MSLLLTAAATLLFVLFGAVLCLVEAEGSAATEVIARARNSGDRAPD